MFSFLGLRKDSKKSASEKEADGGFVIIGETVAEQSRKIQSMSVEQHFTNVIVWPSKSSCAPPAHPVEAGHRPAPVPLGPPAAEASPSVPDSLGDVPFTLAPHIQAMQAGFARIPEVLLSRDVNHNMDNFHYDFSLENSVLCDL